VAEAISGLSTTITAANAASMATLNSIVEACISERNNPWIVNGSWDGVTPCEYAENVTEKVEELIEEIDKECTSCTSHLETLVTDFPLTPMEVQYTGDQFEIEWQNHADCRSEEMALMGSLMQYDKDVSSLLSQQEKACGAPSLQETTSFSCERSAEESQTEYLEGLVKVLGKASKKLLSRRQMVSDCDSATTAYNTKASEKVSNQSLAAKTEECRKMQERAELYSCIHWAWQEEAFARCDESMHSYNREVTFCKEKDEEHLAQINQLQWMLCAMSGNSTNGFCTNYTGVCHPDAQAALLQS
jgi:hypothetical protein